MNALESYTFNMKSSLREVNPMDKVSEEERERVEEKCEQAILWLENNQLAEKEEYQRQLKELEKLCNPSSPGCTRGECQQAAVESRPELAPRGPPSRRWTEADCWTEWNMINMTVMV